MQQKNISTGVKFGIGIGILYCALLYWRWGKASNPFAIGPITAGTYIAIIAILFFEAFYIKKNNGGFIAMKDLFQPLFISVLIFELFFIVYNFVHFTYIDPNVVAKMKAGATEVYKAIPSITDKDKQARIEAYDTLLVQYTHIGKLIQSYITNIAVSGAMAALVAFIMKKNTPATTQ